MWVFCGLCWLLLFWLLLLGVEVNMFCNGLLVFPSFGPVKGQCGAICWLFRGKLGGFGP